MTTKDAALHRQQLAQASAARVAERGSRPVTERVEARLLAHYAAARSVSVALVRSQDGLADALKAIAKKHDAELLLVSRRAALVGRFDGKNDFCANDAAAAALAVSFNSRRFAGSPAMVPLCEDLTQAFGFEPWICSADSLPECVRAAGKPIW